MIAACLFTALALVPQANHARFRLDPPGEIVDTFVTDADGDGLSEFWFATVEDGRRQIVGFVQQGDEGFPAEPTYRLPVSRAVIAWSVGNFLAEAGPEIMLTTRDAAYLQRPGQRPKKIFERAMLLDLPSEQLLPCLREVKDFDGDGLAELLLPTREGFSVVRGSGEEMAEIPWSPRDGRSPTAQQDFLGGRARATLSSQALSDLFVPEESPGIVNRPPLLYSSTVLPRPVLDDLNDDGRADISFWVAGAIRVHLQTADGAFEKVPDRRYALEDGRAQDETVLRWGQFGGGPQADLVFVSSTSGIGVSYDWDIRVWLDVIDRKQLGEPSFFRKVEGSWVRPTIRDLDGDQRPELAISIWELSLGLTLRDPRIEHTLLVFRPEESGWASRAALAESRAYGVEDLESFAVVPAFPGDLTGDGKGDCLQSSGSGELEIRPVELGSRPQIGEAVKRLPVDALAAVVRVQDLNGDGMGDLAVAKLDRWEVYLSRP